MSELLEEMDRGGMDITQNELLDLLGPCGEESSEPDPRVVADSRKILHSLFDGKNRVECLLSFMFVRIFGMKPRWLVGQLSKKSLAELSKEAKLLLMAELDGAKDFIEDCFRALEEQLKRPASELPEIADAIIRRKGH